MITFQYLEIMDYRMLIGLLNPTQPYISSESVISDSVEKQPLDLIDSDKLSTIKSAIEAIIKAKYSETTTQTKLLDAINKLIDTASKHSYQINTNINNKWLNVKENGTWMNVYLKESSLTDIKVNEIVIGKTMMIKFSSCFPNNAIVKVLNDNIISKKMISQLQLDDKVYDGNNYETVIAFSHKNTTDDSTYIKFTFDDKTVLLISPNHYIYCQKKLIPAREIKVNDILSDKNVIKINQVTAKGMISPIVSSGMIEVNGIKCSSFTETGLNKHVASALTQIASIIPINNSYKQKLLNKFTKEDI